jgi:hypothetical protein
MFSQFADYVDRLFKDLRKGQNKQEEKLHLSMNSKHVQERHNSDDEQADGVAVVSEEIRTSETVFLALYALIHSLSVFSSKTTQLLRYSQRCSLIEASITLYQNEKIFNLQPPVNA